MADQIDVQSIISQVEYNITPALNVESLIAQVEYTPLYHIFLTQQTSEVLLGGGDGTKVSQQAAEVIRGGGFNTFVSQQTAEVIRGGGFNTFVSQQVVEVLYTGASTPETPEYYLWPLPFGRESKETIQWQTDILTGDNGEEQRINLRQLPRQIYEVSCYCPYQYKSYINNMLYGWRENIFELPIWTECSQLSSAITSGDSIIYADTRYADYIVGDKCIVYKDFNTYFIGTISAISDTFLLIEELIDIDYNINSFVMPIKHAVLTTDPQVSTNNETNETITLKFQLVDYTTVDGSTAEETFNSLEVITDFHNIESDSNITRTFTKDITVYDFGPGYYRHLSTWDYTRQRTEYIKILQTKGEIWSARQFLIRREGRAVPFYQPTYQVDIEFVDPVSTTAIGTSFYCGDNLSFDLADTRVHIVLFLRDGTHEFNTISSIERYDSSTLLINLTDSTATTPNEVEYISYLGEKRLTSDDIVFTWKLNTLAELSYSITEVRP